MEAHRRASPPLHPHAAQHRLPRQGGQELTIAQTTPDGKIKTGWCIEALITDVATSLTTPGFLDRDYLALSLEVTEVYKTTASPNE